MPDLSDLNHKIKETSQIKQLSHLSQLIHINMGHI